MQHLHALLESMLRILKKLFRVISSKRKVKRVTPDTNKWRGKPSISVTACLLGIMSFQRYAVTFGGNRILPVVDSVGSVCAVANRNKQKRESNDWGIWKRNVMLYGTQMYQLNNRLTALITCQHTY